MNSVISNFNTVSEKELMNVEGGKKKSGSYKFGQTMGRAGGFAAKAVIGGLITHAIW